MANVYYIDGAYVPADAASIPAADLAVTRGYGVFDYLRTYGGQPFHMDTHLLRLEQSAQMLEIALPLPLAGIGAVVLEALARSEPGDHGVRIVVTGGDSSDGLLPSGAARLLVLITPEPRPLAAWFTDGVKLATHRAERYLPEAKTINYIPAILALRRAKAGGAVDSIYVDRDGRALEGTTTNLFAFFWRNAGHARQRHPGRRHAPGGAGAGGGPLRGRAARPAAGRAAARRRGVHHLQHQAGVPGAPD